MPVKFRNFFITSILLTSAESFYMCVGLFYFSQSYFSTRTLFFIIIPGLTLCAIFGTSIVSYLISKKIEEGITFFEETLKNINSISDFRKIDLKNQNFIFSEFRDITQETEKLIKKLSSTSVDNELFLHILKLSRHLTLSNKKLINEKKIINNFLFDVANILEFHAFYFYSKSIKVNLEQFTNPIRNNDEDLNHDVISEFFISMFEQVNSSDLIHIETLKPKYGVSVAAFYKKFNLKPYFDDVMLGIVVPEKNFTLTERLAVETVLSFFSSLFLSIKGLKDYFCKLEYISVKDNLTGLFNQRNFWDEIKKEVESADQLRKELSLMVIDIDNFKLINSSYGHHIGDRLLQEFASVLLDFFKKFYLARYGGDEFVCILKDCSIYDAYNMAEKLREKIEDTDFQIEGENIKVTCSIGISSFPVYAQEPKDLFVLADNLLYRAKKNGKNKTVIPETNNCIELFKDKAKFSLYLKSSFKPENILLTYQPIYNIKKNFIESYEVLTRLKVNDFIVGASEYLDFIRQENLYIDFDMLVVEKVFYEIFLKENKRKFFVNISPVTLAQEKFIHFINNLIEKTKIDTSMIVFEITERETLQNLDSIITNCEYLKKLGFNIAIDDFGSGYSNFIYLKKLPINYVKLEGDFIRNIHNRSDMLLINAIVAISYDYGFDIIAEHVENEAIFNILKGLSIKYGQGFYFGKPETSFVH